MGNADSKNRINKRAIGTAYENEAALFLQKKGYNIVKRNYYCRYGEIDIIARESEYLVFVEVKYRNDTHAGMAEAAVNKGKQRHIIKTAQWYMCNEYGRDDVTCRFDVVAISGHQIHLIRNAFEC